jgi:hypothetical protein
MSRVYVNNFSTTLAEPVAGGDTSFDLTDASGLGTIAAGDFIACTIDDNAGTREIIHVTARSSNTITCTRGQEGTSAETWAGTETIEARLTKKGLDNKSGAVASLYANLPGSYSTFTGKARWYPRTAITLTNIFCSSGTPVAGTDTTFNVLKNGTNIFTSPVPTITIGNQESTPLAMTTSLTTSDYLTIDCTAAGGSDVTIRIDYEPTE